LATGATGYIGGQLVPRLLEHGFKVRVLVRDPRMLAGRPWITGVEVAVGDVLAPDTLRPALSGVDAAYYFVHSMTGGSDFAQQDRVAARNFGRAAKDAGVQRVVYLGALGDERTQLSEHLRSRHETGESLRQSGVSVTEFRAAIIVGPGSISFEMIRYLTERIPTMICPRWVRTKVQPIAIEDVVSYLVAALQNPASAGRIIEIGGPDVLSYGDMMKGYARVRGLPRWLLHVPVLTPRLSSYWVHWVTPISAAYARPLIEGLRNEVVVTNAAAAKLFPEIKPSGYQQSVRNALDELKPAYGTGPFLAVEGAESSACLTKIDKGMIVELRRRTVRSQPEALYETITQLGGQNGWPCNCAWRARAALDAMAGGVGMRRSGPTTSCIQAGDTIDFFRVDQVEPNRMIRLKAEMKLPGAGWLQFEAEPVGEGITNLVQTVFFAPKGLLGIVYWYLLYPAHKLIFTRMIDTLTRRAEDAGRPLPRPGIDRR
ncbi:MAG: SDR family oxidoreductase, partial [Planctomycetota bacterium]